MPAEDLARFGIVEDELTAGRVSDRWRAFMRHQLARNRRLYDFSRQASASAWDKVRRLPALWWRSRYPSAAH